MFKSIPFASRFIPLGALLVLIISFSSCSTKSQLVGRWSYNTSGLPGMNAAQWDFDSDNRCHWRGGSVSGADCTYTVGDDGTIKIEFSGGQKASAKLDGGKLIMTAFGDKPISLSKE